MTTQTGHVSIQKKGNFELISRIIIQIIHRSTEFSGKFFQNKLQNNNIAQGHCRGQKS